MKLTPPRVSRWCELHSVGSHVAYVETWEEDSENRIEAQTNLSLILSAPELLEASLEVLTVLSKTQLNSQISAALWRLYQATQKATQIH